MVRKLTSDEIHDTVRRKYTEISCSVQDRFKYPTGKEAAVLLNYDPAFSGNMPDDAAESFCGVGNPFHYGVIEPGNVVLDVGCGSGFDLIIAGRMSGAKGRVKGIDLVPAMVEKARRNVQEAGLQHCEVILAGSESIPYDENEFDVVISNGSVYLSPYKEKTLLEINRVLKKGGRFQFADVVLKDDLPEDVLRYFDGWSG